MTTNLEKAKILAVGYVIKGNPENWSFDCCEVVPAVTILADGQILCAGYSIPELEQISKEFYGE